jgi:hypothetical protein
LLGGGGNGGGLLGGLLGVGGGGGGLLGGLLGGGRSVEGVNLASKDLDTDMFARSGWLTQDIATPDLDKTQDKLNSVVFMGYGSCPWANPTPELFLASTNVQEAVAFVLKVMRTQCSAEKVAQLVDLLRSGCLELVPDKTLQITPDCPLKSKPKLNKLEASRISLILELELITKSYAKFKGGRKAIPKAPDGTDVSPKMFGFVQGILTGLDLITEKYSSHSLLLFRNLAQTAKYGLVKLLQDYFRLKACPTCKTAFQHVHKDLVYLCALVHFHYSGLGPVILAGRKGNEAFEDWYHLNKEMVLKKTNFYITL